MCFGLGLLNKIFGDGGAGQAKKQAQEEARQARLSQQAAQQARESQINQQRASDAAKALLERPIDKPEVQVGEQVAVTDPETGRKRTPRSSFQINAPSSGLSI